MSNELERCIRNVFDSEYKIPLYQRNFAWEDKEIEKLLQDIYDSFISNKNNPNGKYFVGSLILLKRKTGEYEVIDGQQRLTVLSLIIKLLDNSTSTPRLSYDSREEIDDFLKKFYENPLSVENDARPSTALLLNAIKVINSTNLDLKKMNQDIKIKNADWQERNAFISYFEKNVYLVCVEIPEDTDVASYFEIMNNRGVQLQDHEIIKARLMSKIKKEDQSFDIDKQKIFATIWDACSQMNSHIQANFETDFRKKLFKETYDGFDFDTKELITLVQNQNVKDTSCDCTNEKSIDDIICDPAVKKKYITKAIIAENNETQKKNQNDDIDDDIQYFSIIDFPNFLMHVFKIYYENEKDKVSLHDKFLISTYNEIENQIQDPLDFLQKLIWCRTLFDRYIVKTIDPVKMDWSLKHAYKSNNSLKFRLTFGKDKNKDITNDNEEETDSQEKCVKALSMLQVTFRSRYYKKYLQHILKWLSKKDSIEISSEDYLKFLNAIMIKTFENIPADKWNDKGEDTPQYVLNFIDYLYWIKAKKHNGILLGKDYKDFTLNPFVFRNLNSVEHHLARNVANQLDGDTPKGFCEQVNNLGNLYLLGKNDNSRLNDRFVAQKIQEFFTSDNKLRTDKNLGPNRQIMYTISKIKWEVSEITNHTQELIELISDKYNLLNITEKEAKELTDNIKFSATEID